MHWHSPQLDDSGRLSQALQEMNLHDAFFALPQLENGTTMAWFGAEAFRLLRKTQSALFTVTILRSNNRGRGLILSYGR